MQLCCQLVLLTSRGKKRKHMPARSQVMETGIKLNITKPIRSPKTGMFLPREGTLVSVTENLGRTLLLVEFEDGQHEYLFDHEVEFETGNAPPQNYGTGTDAHI